MTAASTGRRVVATCRRSLVLAKVTGSSRKDERVAVAADLLAELLQQVHDYLAYHNHYIFLIQMRIRLG